MKSRNFFIIGISIILILFFVFQKKEKINNPLTNSSIPQKTTNDKVSILAKNLDTPWSLAFLPNHDLIFTERKGSLNLISNNNITKIDDIEDVLEYGEGGLMGVEVHPNYKKNKFIYLMYTFRGSGNNTLNRLVRYKLENNKLSDKKIIIDNIPGAIYHNGGKIKFGPDGFLYITTGDSLEPSLAQNKNSLAGKILKITDDGKPAPGNPFNNLIYSYGHRNPQGITWDSDGNLWETEHGRSNPSGYDELNLIVKGANYGWPEIQGTEKKSGMQTPLAQSGNETWAPGGIIFFKDELFFGGLKGESLYKVKIENENAIINKLFLNQFGRIRDVILGPDNFIYITTSNLDGRGSPKSGDDKIIKIDPQDI